MEGLSEAIELIQETAVRANLPRVTKLEGQPRYVIVSKGGTLEKHELPAPRWQHRVDSLWSLIEAANHVDVAKTTVWHNATSITLVHDMEWRRDTVTFPLEETDCLVALRSLVKNGKHNQASLIKLLRVKMDEAKLADLILVLRSLTFRSGQQVQSEVQHGSTSMGKSIEQALATKNLEQPLPEDFFVACRYWANLPPEIGERLIIKTKVAIDVDFAEGAFDLTPSRDDLITNAQWAHDQLATWLGEHLPRGVAVYHGNA